MLQLFDEIKTEFKRNTFSESTDPDLKNCAITSAQKVLIFNIRYS
jgi:hypothetical protein